jgi:hypothetical protein
MYYFRVMLKFREGLAGLFFRGALLRRRALDILIWTITVSLGRLGDLWNGQHLRLKKYA